MPKVSVVIPAYNVEKSLTRTLSSILSQKCEGQIEIIVVDDCSTDCSWTLMQDTARRVGNLRVFRLASNQGPAAARNKGITEAKGDYIAFLDADDYWRQGFLAKTSSFLDNHPDVGCVFTGQEHKTLSSSSSIEPKCLLFDNPPTTPTVLEDFFSFWQEQGVPPICSGSLMVRNDLLQKIGGQRVEFRICEDLEYWCYIALHTKMGFIPDVLFVSDGARGADSCVTQTRRKRLQKFKLRWHNARCVKEWAARLYASQTLAVTSTSFSRVIGSVASILIYSMIQDGRWKEALMDFRDYQQWLPSNPVCRFLALFSHYRPLWNMACLALWLRERIR